MCMCVYVYVCMCVCVSLVPVCMYICMVIKVTLKHGCHTFNHLKNTCHKHQRNNNRLVVFTGTNLYIYFIFVIHLYPARFNSIIRSSQTSDNTIKS